MASSALDHSLLLPMLESRHGHKHNSDLDLYDSFLIQIVAYPYKTIAKVK